jgi:hypothetical protein
LNLNYNHISDQFDFRYLFKLSVLDIESNLITRIQSHDFFDLKNLRILNPNLNPINVIEPESFFAFGSVILKITLSMPNISLKNIHNLKDSLKPQMVRKFVHINYFAPTHIENRADIDCVKTLYFMRLKILYNFFNEHNDINDFLINCMNSSQVRNELDKLENSSNHLIEYSQDTPAFKKVNIIDSPKNLIIYLFISVTIVISIIFLIHRYVLKTLKTKNNQSEPKMEKSFESRSVLQSNTLDFIDIELLNE